MSTSITTATSTIEQNMKRGTPASDDVHFVVLDVLVRAEEPLTDAEIADKSPLSPSTVRRALVDLRGWGSVAAILSDGGEEPVRVYEPTLL